MDRIALHVFVRQVDVDAFDKVSSTTSAVLGELVLAARERQTARNGDGVLNGRLSERLVRRHCRLDVESAALLVQAQKKLHVSARGRSHVLRVARTIADLDGADSIGLEHITEAVQYRARSGQR